MKMFDGGYFMKVLSLVAVMACLFLYLSYKGKTFELNEKEIELIRLKSEIEQLEEEDAINQMLIDSLLHVEKTEIIPSNNELYKKLKVLDGDTIGFYDLELIEPK